MSSAAETFYERSRSILPLDSLDRRSIGVAQYLLPAARQVLARQNPSTSPSLLEHAIRKIKSGLC